MSRIRSVLWETFASGTIREVPTKEGDDWIELEGTPDWILEIVSPRFGTQGTGAEASSERPSTPEPTKVWTL